MRNVLVACEESQVVTKHFRARGFSAYSCDVVECSGGHPEWHIREDVLDVMLEGNWDLMIAHPPCTYLTVTGNKWMKPEFRDRFPDRPQQREDAIKFFMALADADIGHIAIENPVGIMSTEWRKPDQYVHPYWFGDEHSKKTGLWLKNLPLLKATDMVEPDMYVYKDGRRDPMWHVRSMGMPPSERARYRSKTFPGFAKAMADQWGDYILGEGKIREALDH